MGKGIDYRFRVRENDGMTVIHYHSPRVEAEYDTFSKPQRMVADPHSHETIIRPPFKRLEGVEDKYLDKVEPAVKTKKKKFGFW